MDKCPLLEPNDPNLSGDKDDVVGCGPTALYVCKRHIFVESQSKAAQKTPENKRLPMSLIRMLPYHHDLVTPLRHTPEQC